jgi:hypothetical protein
MSKALILGTAALVLSAVSASAADLAPPGYADPGYGYAAPPAPSSSTVVIVTPAPAYAASPVVSGYYGAPVVSQPIYDYAPDYGYDYTPGYWNRGYWGRWYR